MKNDLADYLLDNYGTCTLKSACVCRRTVWLGRACGAWQTLGARTWEELAEKHDALYAEKTLTKCAVSAN